MTLFERLRHLGNSPTHERDVASMFSVLRLGTWFFVLNAVLIAAIGGTLWILSNLTTNSRFDSRFFQSLSLSDILTSVVFLSMTAFLTVFVPIRVVGPIMGPRSGRYFDQIVLSGIDPVRYFSGKVMSQNVFLIVIAVAALPYMVFCISVGGIRIEYTLLGIGVLAFYTNVLALATLFFSVFLSEIASLLVILMIAATTFLVGLYPLAPNPSIVSPSAVFMAPLFETLMFPQVRGVIELSAWTNLQSLHPAQIQLALFLISGALIAAIAVLSLVIGPLNCINQENSTFGEIVMNGDSRKRGFLKRRFLLRLRSEISFFYENRAPWLRRWDFALRWGILEFVFLLGLALPFAVFPWVGRGFDISEMIVSAFFAGLLWILLNNALFLKDRSTERLCFRGLEAGQVDILFYMANLIMIAAASAQFLFRAEEMLDKSWFEQSWLQNAPGGAFSQPPVWHLPWVAVAITLGVLGFQLHWLARLISLRLWSKWSALFCAFALFVGISFLPMSPYLSVRAAAPTQTYAQLELPLAIAANFSGAVGLFHCLDDYPYRALDFEEHGFHIMLEFQLIIGLVLMLVYFRTRRKLPLRELN